MKPEDRQCLIVFEEMGVEWNRERSQWTSCKEEKEENH